MSEVSDYIKRAATRSGFKRQFFIEKNMPTQPSNVLAIPFFGDIRSTFIFASLFLKNYKEMHPDKYLILCSWPGIQGLFPYIDEFWTLEDDSAIKTLAMEAINIYNTSSLAAEITRGLSEVLDVFTARDIKEFYMDGFKKKYHQEFSHAKRFLPEIPAANKISENFKSQINQKQGQKIIVYPALKMRSWQQGQTINLPSNKDFWSALIERLIKEGFVPVIYQNQFTYDMSREFVDRCLYLTSTNMLDVLAAFRHIGCVLDIHTGVSRLALAARCPYVGVIERQSFVHDKDYEIDDLCGEKLPRQYVFSFSTQLMHGELSDWNLSLLDVLIKKLIEFLPSIDINKLPATNESYVEIPWNKVRQKKAKRMGLFFLRSSKSK